MGEPYYRKDLALVHHLGFGSHADKCAPGILRLLEPVLDHSGLVLELGCGSGLLTRHLVEAGHRVIATDASPAMLELAAAHTGGAERYQRLVLPDDPLPAADAVVAVGHPLNYLDDAAAIERALVAAATALSPGGILAIDLCDLEYGSMRGDPPASGTVGDDWAIITEFSRPAPERFDRSITTFVRASDGSWQRDDELHRNVLVDTSTIPGLLARHGIHAEIGQSFGDDQLPAGLMTVIGRRIP
ncbi:MAG: class I SAM-dependent DNA methyltransferase [Acidimicrobiia bacterium]